MHSLDSSDAFLHADVDALRLTLTLSLTNNSDEAFLVTEASDLPYGHVVLTDTRTGAPCELTTAGKNTIGGEWTFLRSSTRLTLDAGHTRSWTIDLREYFKIVPSVYELASELQLRSPDGATQAQVRANKVVFTVH